MIAVFFQQALNGIILGSLYMLVALGLFLIFGILEVTNFAHGEFYMLGAFATLFVMTGLGAPFLPAVVLAMLCMAAFGIMVERVVFRPIVGKPLINGMLLSFGLSTFLTNAALLLFTADPRKIESEFAQVHLRFLGLHVTLERLLALAVGTALVGFLAYFIQHTKTGKAMRAVSENKEVSALMGIDIDRVIVSTFFIGSALGGAAGVLVGLLFTQVYHYMGFTAGLKGFTAAVVGGIGSIPGAMVGGLLLGLAESIGVGFVSPRYKDLIAFGVLILLLLVRARGILGALVSDKV